MEPLVIAEIGINHNGNYSNALQMVRDAANAGCKCVKFQCHVVEDEYIPLAKTIIPANADENIYNMMQRCALSERADRWLKEEVENLGMQYLSTPFSRAAVDRLERLGATMYKIGSGECNNYPLIKHIVSTGKPIILSTGMNGWLEIDKAVDIIGDQMHAILHCVSEYPTPYEHVNLNRMLEIKERYGKPVGLSDHSQGIYTALAAVALGAVVVEKHFTSDKNWTGADIPISISPGELGELIRGASAIWLSIRRNNGEVPWHDNTEGHTAENRTSEFAFASVVSLCPIRAGMRLSPSNCWVKRPAGGIPAASYEYILGRAVIRDIEKDEQIKWEDLTEEQR